MAVRDYQRAIKLYNEKMSATYKVYVLAPVHHYNVENHVRAETDKSIYAGAPCAQAFIAINMAIPMFRSLVQNLEAVTQQVNRNTHSIEDNQRAINSNQKEIVNLAKRIESLQKMVEEQQAQALIEAAKTADALPVTTAS